MKPGRDRVDIAPLMPWTWFGFFVQHVVSRSVRDSALVLDLSSGGGRRFAVAAQREPGKLRLGLYRNSPLGLEVSTETLAAMETARQLAPDAGHEVEEIDLPMIGRAFLADFCRVVCASIAGIMHTHTQRLGRRPHGELERTTRVVAQFGDNITAGEVYAALHRLNETVIELVAHTGTYDAVLMPVIAHPPLPVGTMAPKGADDFLENMLDRLRLTRLLRAESLFGQFMDKSLWFTHWPAIQNVTGQPAIALPVHVTAEALPLGIQAVGRPGDEETLFSLAAQMERDSGWLERRAPLMVPEG